MAPPATENQSTDPPIDRKRASLQSRLLLLLRSPHRATEARDATCPRALGLQPWRGPAAKGRAMDRVLRELGLAGLGSIISPSASIFGLVGRFRRRIWLSRWFFLAIRWVIAHFEGFCAEIWPFKNVGVDVCLFRVFLEALVALIVFLVSYSS